MYSYLWPFHNDAKERREQSLRGETNVYRLLAVDDEAGMLTLYQDILELGESAPLPLAAAAEGRVAPHPTGGLRFELTICEDGRDAVRAVQEALAQDAPFAVALVDVRLRSGPDGVWTAEAIRQVDPDLEIVMVTAYTDVSLEELNRRIPPPGKLLYLQKPFRPQELRQLAISLCNKWSTEQELRVLNETLAQRVERRISHQKALEEQLRQAQKMEALGTLAGGIAHDFNNILGVMLGYSELIREGAGQDQSMRRRVDEIMRAGSRARDLINQILNFSRQGPQERRPLKLIPLIKEAMKLLRSSIPSSVAIHTVFETREDLALADPTQFHQIVLNLCANAAQAMGERGGELVIRLADADENAPARLHDPRWFLHLSVSDTGPGMDPEIMERIFEPFFTTKAPGEGTGLGLSVVHGIVKTHEGAVSVESEKGRGSTFHVYLPRARAEAAPAPAALPVLQPGKGRVLVVDDEKPLVDIAREMLEGFGFEVTARTSSVEALEAFRFRPEDFDLVVTDYAMPNMTGVELSQELLKIRPGLPVILCTGFSDTISVERAQSLGICDVIMKPILKNKLVQSVSRLLETPPNGDPDA
ncbi:hybrid sensor histidine kinase/response regulator [Paucidesulfovibrio longus]|uniref:hybrid sensor histidine kinase/response regulator n=1 Tax=Paucidesulfovibrio longus TaxID=889 RepID=UPI0003B3BADF|nr:response regulator [Paucidesulfovibrio longus]